MEDFVRALAKHVTDTALRLPEGQSWRARLAIDGVRDVLLSKPEAFVVAIETALIECNLELKSKGNMTMRFSLFKSYLKKALPMLRFISFLTPNKVDDAAVAAIERIVEASDAGAVDWAIVRAAIEAAVPVVDEVLKISFVPDSVRQAWSLIKTFLLGSGVGMPAFDPEA